MDFKPCIIHKSLLPLSEIETPFSSVTVSVRHLTTAEYAFCLERVRGPVTVAGFVQRDQLRRMLYAYALEDRSRLCF
jgi:hypothetical protein